MSAQSPTVVQIRAIQRPRFENTRLCSFRQWIDDNANTLARYWQAQGNALGLTQDDDTDFDFWLRVQYDIERADQSMRKAS